MFGRTLKQNTDRIMWAVYPLFMNLRSHVRYNYFLLASIPLAAGLSFWLSYQLRFDFNVPIQYSQQSFLLLPYVVVIKLALFYVLRGHSADWRYVGMRDIIFIGFYAFICAVILLSFWSFRPWSAIPRGVVVIDSLLTLVLTGGIRISARFVREQVIAALRDGQGTDSRPTIIIGAGDAGEMLLREIHRNPTSEFSVKAFFDDDSARMGTSIHGVRVRGGVEQVESYMNHTPIDTAIIAIPSANRSQMKRINDMLKELNIAVKTLPPLHEIMERAPTVTQLRDIDITDLLGREELQIDAEQIYDLIHDKVVLVTGAGGSIGSELCRQILRRDPKKLILLERSENGLFHVHRTLREHAYAGHGGRLVPLLLDVRNSAAVSRAMKKEAPDLVFHAAAHKHVAMQELNPLECFKNNVGGIQTIARACAQMGVDRFLLVSTDKAVNPTSVMGATKRVCELYCQALGYLYPTKFMSVRFGNVLVSEGSVVPIFLEQIARGGPVTITHPEVRRYFMSIPEAVALILQATTLGESGQVMMLDMGEAIKIVDLARYLINLAGKSEHEVPIQFTDLRPGEKLFEQILGDSEVCLPTAHEKIKVFSQTISHPREVVEKVDRAVEAAFQGPDDTDARQLLNDLVPEVHLELQESSPDHTHEDSGRNSGLSGRQTPI